MSFKEFRDLLVLLYGDEIISDEEFLLLYDSFISKNPDFPHENYQRFDLDSMNSAECKAEFRVEKHDLPRLVAALQLPPVFKCEQRSICDDMEGLCILLKRVAQLGAEVVFAAINLERTGNLSSKVARCDYNLLII